MPKEIERKFLVKRLPEGWQQHKHEMIAQGYLFNSKEGVVRLRRKGDSYFQTIKSQGKKVRDEIEFELSQSQFDLMWQYIKGQSISKTRYYIPFKSHLIELDLFEESLQGLILAEVEFEDEETCDQFMAPDWFGEEVTEDFRYHNSTLAIHGLPSKNL